MGAEGLPKRVLGTGRTAEAEKSMLEDVGQVQTRSWIPGGAADETVLLLKVKTGERSEKKGRKVHALT